MPEGEPTPDFRPLYAQIRDLLAARVARGQWRPGEVLPSEPRLASEFGVSQGTVRKALDLLEEQHMVVRQQGRGTFVARHTPDRALFAFFHLVGDDGSRRLPESRALSCRAGRASRGEAGTLDLATGAEVVRIVRVRSLDARPVIAERIVIPAGRFPGLGDQDPGDLPNTLYALYEGEYGVAVAEAEERLRAIAAGVDEARLLGVEVGLPLLEVDRVARGHDGRAVEWRVSRCDTRAHHYHSHLR